MHSPELVLVVDDDPLLLATLGDALRSCEMASVLAGSLEAALDALGRGVAPDAILVDLDLHEPPGLTALARLQSHPAAGDVPVLALGSNPGDLLRADPAEAVLLKPFELEHLRRRLLAACDRPPMQ